MRFNGMQRISEYTQSLSVVSRARYESKVTSTGLNTDPYAIDDSQWAIPLFNYTPLQMTINGVTCPGGYREYVSGVVI